LLEGGQPRPAAGSQHKPVFKVTPSPIQPALQIGAHELLDEQQKECGAAWIGTREQLADVGPLPIDDPSSDFADLVSHAQAVPGPQDQPLLLHLQKPTGCQSLAFEQAEPELAGPPHISMLSSAAHQSKNRRGEKEEMRVAWNPNV